MTRAVEILLALTVIFAAACIAVVQAWGAPPDHSDPALAPWFESLTNPATGLSCCASFDGHILSDHDWRPQGDIYQVRIAGVWRDVPKPAVLDRIDNPTGGAVAFYSRAADSDPNTAPFIYCFIRPVET